MIKPLRKRHLQIWTLWAVLIPVGIIVAWIAVPKKVTQELNKVVNLVQPIPGQDLEITLKVIDSVEKENYKTSIRVDSVLGSFIEFTNKEELTSPTLLLYRISDSTSNSVDEQELLGRIESKGTQVFRFTNNLIELKKPLNREKFILYDIIKNKIIDSVIFKTLRQ